MVEGALLLISEQEREHVLSLLVLPERLDEITVCQDPRGGLEFALQSRSEDRLAPTPLLGNIPGAQANACAWFQMIFGAMKGVIEPAEHHSQRVDI